MGANIQIERSTHENIYVTCPKCDRLLTFNRVSDLEETQPIGGMDVSCMHTDCCAEFRICMDACNPPHDLLVAESVQLMAEKNYGAAIIKLTTALESLFSLYLRAEMVYRPLATPRAVSTRDMNVALNELREKTGKLPYVYLRNIVVRHAVALKKLPEASLVVAEIRKLDTKPGCPKDIEINAVKPRELSEFLLKLKSLKVHEIRNKIAHQRSHRPSRHETEQALDQVSELMARADTVLGTDLGDDPDAYRFLDQGHLGREPLETWPT